LAPLRKLRQKLQLRCLPRDDEWKANDGLVSKLGDLAHVAKKGYIHKKLSDRLDLLAKVTPKQAPMVRRGVADNGF
jgi:hypothetical protein